MEGAKFEDELARLLKAVGSGKLKDLAAALSISEQAVSKALKKKKIPKTWAYTLSTKTNHSLEWLLYGAEEENGLERSGTDAATALKTSVTACPRCLELYDKLVQLLEENGQVRLENVKIRAELDTARQMCKEFEAENAKLQEQISLLTSSGDGTAQANTA